MVTPLGDLRVPMVHQACQQAITSFLLSSDEDYQAAKARMREHVKDCWAAKKEKA